MKLTINSRIISLCSVLALSACGGAVDDPNSTPTPGPSKTPKSEPTPSPEMTKTPKPKKTPGPVETTAPTAEPNPTPEPEPEPTKTPKPVKTPKPTPSPEPEPSQTPAPIGDAAKGKSLMNSAMCSTCHSDNGDGSFGAPFEFDMANLEYPSETQYKADSAENLAKYIADLMPKGGPDACVDECANDIASYLWTYVKEEEKPEPQNTPEPEKTPKPTNTPKVTGLLKDFPFEQIPQIGEPEIVWMRTEFDGAKLLVNHEDKIRGAFKSFNKYVGLMSKGRFQLKELHLSPLFKSNLDNPANKNVSEMAKKSRDLAASAGFNINYPYKAYVFTAPDFNFGGVGGGGEKGGELIMGPNLFTGGTMHEMFHMFSIGHAEALEGGDQIFPGKNVGGLDPFHFMGSIEDQKTCTATSVECEVFAPLSIQHRARLGWLDNEEITLSAHDGEEHIFKIYNQDTYNRPEPRLLAAYLTGYEKEGAFIVSYIKKSKGQMITNPGVIVHYVPYASPGISRYLDLTPNSKTSNPVYPNSDAHNMIYDFGDGAIQQGDAVDVSNFFNIQVLSEGMDGDDDYWAEVKIVPLGEAVNRK